MHRGVKALALVWRVFVLAVVLAFAAAAPAAAAPSVTIDSGPQDPTPTNDPTPTFGFTADGGILIDCSVDQGIPVFLPCDSSSAHTPSSLPDGSWTFRVRVTDLLLQTATATRQFTVDTQAPSITINSGPSGPTSDQTPTFGFTREAGSTVQCSVDQGTADFGACSANNSHTPSPLGDGDWTFRVREVDAAGNAGVATRSFSVDSQAPGVTIDSGPSGPTNDQTPTFGFTREAG
jgi:hypothetical protein